MRLLSPRLIVLHLLGVVATTVAVLLGLWQYDAWQTGRELAARDLANARPVPLHSVLTPDGVFSSRDVGRPVTLEGEWLPDSTLLVTDRRHDGRSGRWVVTPVAVCAAAPGTAGDSATDAATNTDCDHAPALLVVRGWLAQGHDVPAAPTGATALTGWLQPGEGSGTADPDPTDNVLPELRIASAIQHVDRDLYGGFVVADEVASRPAASSSSGQLVPVTPASLPQPGSSISLRNLLYAVEWWVFAGFAAFLWWRWVRDELDTEGPNRPGGGSGGDPDGGEGRSSVGNRPEPRRSDAEIASAS